MSAPLGHTAGRLCAIALVLPAFVAPRFWGFTPYTLLFAAFALCYPAVMLYGGRLSPGTGGAR